MKSWRPSYLQVAYGVVLITSILSVSFSMLYFNLDLKREQDENDEFVEQQLQRRMEQVEVFLENKINLLQSVSVLPTRHANGSFSLDMTNMWRRLSSVHHNALFCGCTVRVPHSQRSEFERIVGDWHGVNASVSEIDNSRRSNQSFYEVAALSTSEDGGVITNLAFRDLLLFSGIVKEINFAKEHGAAISLPRDSPTPGVDRQVITIYSRILQADSDPPPPVSKRQDFNAWASDKHSYRGSVACLFYPDDMLNFYTDPFMNVRVRMNRDAGTLKDVWQDVGFVSSEANTCQKFAMHSTEFEFCAHIRDTEESKRSNANTRNSFTALIAILPVVVVGLLAYAFGRQRQLNKSRVNAERSRQDAVRQFLYHTSHDMRTPLQAIYSIVEELPEIASALVDHPSLQLLQSCVEVLQVTVSNVLDASLIERNTLKLQTDHFYIPAMLKDIKSMLNMSTHAKREVELRLTTLEDFPQVIGDAGRIKRAVMNLTTNALRATTSGSVHIFADMLPGMPAWITKPGIVNVPSEPLGSQPAGDETAIEMLAPQQESDSKDHIWVRFRVLDTGAGMPERALQRLQSSSTMHQAESNSNSTGLGLQICRHVSSAYNGGMEVQTGPIGSMFTIVMRLPTASDSDLSTDVQTATASRSQSPEAPTPTQSESTVSACQNEPKTAIQSSATSSGLRESSSKKKQPCTVIVVDDTEMLRNILVRNVRRIEEVKIVIEAEDGENGLQTIMQNHSSLSLVLSDILMPKMTGDEMIQQLRKWENANGYRHLPAYAITGNANVDDFQKYQAMGFDGVLSKPVKNSAIRELVQSVLSDKGAMEQAAV